LDDQIEQRQGGVVILGVEKGHRSIIKILRGRFGWLGECGGASQEGQREKEKKIDPMKTHGVPPHVMVITLSSFRLSGNFFSPGSFWSILRNQKKYGYQEIVG
jgi:hypothetical protein